MFYTVLDFLENSAHQYPDKIAFADVNTSVTWKYFVQNAKKMKSMFEFMHNLITSFDNCFTYVTLWLYYTISIFKKAIKMQQKSPTRKPWGDFCVRLDQLDFIVKRSSLTLIVYG